MEKILEFDGNMLLWIQEHLRVEWLNEVFIFITHLGDKGALWIGAAVLLLCFKKTRKVGILVILSLLLSLLINNCILKNIVARTRPYEMVEGLTRLIGRQRDYSFPSGHTASSFAAASVMFLCLPKKYGITAVIAAVLIGFSRLYIGVHYPTDVLFGAISGCIIGALVVFVGNELKNKKMN